MADDEPKGELTPTTRNLPVPAVGGLDITWWRLLTVGVPAGLTIAFIHAELLVPMLIVAGVAVLVGVTTPLFKNPRFQLGLDEFRDGDYSPWVYAGYLAPGIAAAVSPVFGDLFNSTLTIPTVLGLWTLPSILATTFSLRAMLTRQYRVGVRRGRKVLASATTLDGLTQARMETTHEFRALLKVLVSFGAIDGVTVTLKPVAAALGTEAESLRADVALLHDANLIQLTKIGRQNQPEKWTLTLTPLGLRCLNEATRR